MSFTLGFNGCGGWAKRKYLPYLRKQSGVEVAAFCELVLPNEKAEVAKQFPKAKFYDTLEQMLANEQLDGVIVTLPHSLHLPRILTSLKHGLPVFTDKPAGVSSQEIKQIMAAEKKTGKQVLVGCQRRSLPGYKEIRKHFRQAGSPARWMTGTFYFSSYPNWEKTWRNDPKLSGRAEARQGVLLDTGYHLIDSMLYILDFPKPLNVYAQANYRGYNVEADVAVTVQCEHELTIQFNVSRDAKESQQTEALALLTDSNYFAFGQHESNGVKKSTFIAANGTDKAEILDFPSSPIAHYPLAAFLELLEGKAVSEKWTVGSSLVTMQIIDAAYQSIQSKSPKAV